MSLCCLDCCRVAGVLTNCVCMSGRLAKGGGGGERRCDDDVFLLLGWVVVRPLFLRLRINVGWVGGWV